MAKADNSGRAYYYKENNNVMAQKYWHEPKIVHILYILKRATVPHCKNYKYSQRSLGQNNNP